MNRPAILAATLTLCASPALSDPCEAPVTGYKPGQVISAPVVYVGDGDSICLMMGRDPADWLEIRIADFNAPELSEPGGKAAKRVMDGLIGRKAACTVQRGKSGRVVSYDRVIASCRIEGRSVAEIMGAAGVAEGGRGFGR